MQNLAGLGKTLLVRVEPDQTAPDARILRRQFEGLAERAQCRIRIAGEGQRLCVPHLGGGIGRAELGGRAGHAQGVVDAASPQAGRNRLRSKFA